MNYTNKLKNRRSELSFETKLQWSFKSGNCCLIDVCMNVCEHIAQKNLNNRQLFTSPWTRNSSNFTERPCLWIVQREAKNVPKGSFRKYCFCKKIHIIGRIFLLSACAMESKLEKWQKKFVKFCEKSQVLRNLSRTSAHCRHTITHWIWDTFSGQINFASYDLLCLLVEKSNLNFYILHIGEVSNVRLFLLLSTFEAFYNITWVCLYQYGCKYWTWQHNRSS